MRISAFQRRRGRERGAVAVVVIVTMLAVLMIYTMSNVRTLVYLQGELKLLEQRQTQRWSKAGGLRAVELRATNVSVSQTGEVEP
ncbi:MAG: hypothetical protein N3I86_10760 [Verrucomicrobiae bacterium]|nr:hypothetical protein [Verrucomicrobiae bacterium]MDW8310481.1 hypothetical protein [Verrucomicrobiales bacterium]